MAAADVVAAFAKSEAAIAANQFVIFANTATANRAQRDRGTTAIHNASGYQASGDYLLAPAFSLNEGSHKVLLSAAMRLKWCSGARLPAAVFRARI